jgi:hypothetical protein
MIPNTKYNSYSHYKWRALEAMMVSDSALMKSYMKIMLTTLKNKIQSTPRQVAVEKTQVHESLALDATRSSSGSGLPCAKQEEVLKPPPVTL